MLNNPEEILAQHLNIEARITEGNPPEVIETARKTHVTLLNFKKWLAERAGSRRNSTANHRGFVRTARVRSRLSRSGIAEILFGIVQQQQYCDRPRISVPL